MKRVRRDGTKYVEAMRLDMMNGSSRHEGGDWGRQLFDLTGKVALVTGGNGGIGLGMAQGMASCGASIVIAGRNEAKAGPALASLRELGARCAFITGDVTKKAACVKLVADTVAEFGRLDILVNNAGTSIRKMPELYTEEEWHEVLNTNLTSAFLCSQAAYAPMKQQGGGQDDQHRLDDVAVRCAVCNALCVEQGRHRADDPRVGDRVGEGQHPGELRCCPAGSTPT